jgi:hypothetical protein
VVELAMAATLANLKPAILYKQAQQLRDFHAAILTFQAI